MLKERSLISTSTKSSKSELKSITIRSDDLANKINLNKIKLERLTSNFFALPIYHDDHLKTKSFIYISSNASLKNSNNLNNSNHQNDLNNQNDQNNQNDLNNLNNQNNQNDQNNQKDENNQNNQNNQKDLNNENDQKNQSINKTLFLTNLPRHTNVESLKQFFINNFKLNSNSFQIILNQNQKNSNSFSSLQREIQINLESNSKIPPLFQSHINLNSTSNLLLPTAHLCFQSSALLNKILYINSSSLPLLWPKNSINQNFLSHYSNRRKLSRPPLDLVKIHTDKWMAAWESRQILPLPLSQNSSSKSSTSFSKNLNQNPHDSNDGWTIVTRGGRHGRSSTTTSQPSSSKAPDPYAQSSMADRDQTAAVKVMKRGFAQSFQNSINLNHPKKKLKGANLNLSFYPSKLTNSKKIRINELQNKFNQDKARIEKIRQDRTFKPF